MPFAPQNLPFAPKICTLPPKYAIWYLNFDSRPSCVSSFSTHNIKYPLHTTLPCSFLLVVCTPASALLMCCAYLAPSLLMYSWNIRAWIAHLSWQKVSMLQLHTGRVLSRPCCCPLFIFLTPCTPASLWTLLQSALAPPFATQAHTTFAFHLPDFYAELATGGRIHACS